MSFIKYLLENSNSKTIDRDFEKLLTEGVHDKSIFKAVFLGGGPGSGKDFVLDNTLSGQGLTEIDSNKAFEYLMDKENPDMEMPESEQEQKKYLKSRAKSMADLKQRLALLGRNGLIINGTGDDPDKIKKIKQRLEELGYDTMMLMVNTEDEVSKQRNIERGQRGGRTLPEKIRKQKWDAVQYARPEYGKLFGSNYIEFDNSEDLRTATPDVVKSKKDELADISNTIEQFLSTPPENQQSQDWLVSELKKKDTLPVPKNGARRVSHSSSAAEEEAKRLGLQYYGFGRYGINGVVTYRTIYGVLTPVEKIQKMIEVSEKPPKKKEKLKEGLRNWLDINSKRKNNLSEAVSVSFSADTPEELNQAVSNFFNTQQEMPTEEYSFSGKDALTMLTGSNKVSRSFIRNDEYTITNEDLQQDIIESENYIKDDAGNLRVFLMRRTAAKEAHEKNGEIAKHAKGWIVKVNGIKESIDKGIETGTSMAGAGESIGRDMGEKIKKRTGKASPVAETIGAGGEMATSMSDQKEDELRKKGISLTTFKAKRPIG